MSYYTATTEDHEVARQEYVDRVPMPSRCMHSVPLKEACRDCEVWGALDDVFGFDPNMAGERPAFMAALDTDDHGARA